MLKLKVGCLLSLTLGLVLLTKTPFVLAVEPPVNLRAIVNSPTEIRWEWDWAEGAQQYEVTVDGLVIALTPNTWYTSRGIWPGEHSMSLKTVDENDRYSLPSVEIYVNSAAANNDNASITNNENNNSASDQNPNIENANSANNDATVDVGNTDNSTTDSPSNVDIFSRKLRSVLHGLNTVVVNRQAARIDPETRNYPGATNKPGYTLTFSDEFNGYSLDTAKWNTQLRWDGEYNGERYEYRIINGEAQFYVNIYSRDQQHLNNLVPRYNPFQFNGERLAIRAQLNPLKSNDGNADHGSLLAMLTQQDFLSGVISTYDKFVQKYGYFEARIKIPSQTGAFPAFWLHHQRRENENTRKTEIDIMENLGHAPWFIYNSFHYFDNVSEGYSGDAKSLKPSPEGQIYNGTDFSLDYHTYAVEWKPGYIAWYIDDQKVSELSDGNIDHEELYLILNLAVGGNWTNYPTDSGGLGRPADDLYPNWDDLNAFGSPVLEIDYVRVYQRN